MRGSRVDPQPLLVASAAGELGKCNRGKVEDNPTLRLKALYFPRRQCTLHRLACWLLDRSPFRSSSVGNRASPEEALKLAHVFQCSMTLFVFKCSFILKVRRLADWAGPVLGGFIGPAFHHRSALKGACALLLQIARRGFRVPFSIDYPTGKSKAELAQSSD
jgi:hypothetical protein